ncbi:hypothetical protein BDR26DRAFT_883389, partial [Obelidium mucronatum]
MSTPNASGQPILSPKQKQTRFRNLLKYVESLSMDAQAIPLSKLFAQFPQFISGRPCVAIRRRLTAFSTFTIDVKGSPKGATAETVFEIIHRYGGGNSLDLPPTSDANIPSIHSTSSTSSIEEAPWTMEEPISIQDLNHAAANVHIRDISRTLTRLYKLITFTPHPDKYYWNAMLSHCACGPYLDSDTMEDLYHTIENADDNENCGGLMTALDSFHCHLGLTQINHNLCRLFQKFWMLMEFASHYNPQDCLGLLSYLLEEFQVLSGNQMEQLMRKIISVDGEICGRLRDFCQRPGAASFVWESYKDSCQQLTTGPYLEITTLTVLAKLLEFHPRVSLCLLHLYYFSE